MAQHEEAGEQAERARPDADELRQRLERILLGGTRRYTRSEVARAAGVSPDRTQRLWRALGFATVGEDDKVFTDADIEAVRLANSLVAAGLIEQGAETAVTRALGLHLSRLAEWQVHMLWELVTANPELAGDERRIGRLVERLLPDLQQVQDFVWRRHLAAFADRAFTTGDEDLEARTEVVGFVDMVGYTRLSRRIGEAELNEILDRFEGLSTEVIAEHRGRVVKMIGDEVLFVADSPVAAAEIALTLTERTDADDELPAVRAGLAAGRILSRFGDVYGPVVNLASRLTSVARPRSVLVDRDLADQLAAEPGYELRSRRAVTVRGYHRMRPAALRRSHRPAGELFESSQRLAAEMLGLTGADDEDQGAGETEDQPANRVPRRRPRGGRRA
jgi:adenylate cyclase